MKWIKAKIMAYAELLAQEGEMKRRDGRSLSKTITDLFDELRELEMKMKILIGLLLTVCLARGDPGTTTIPTPKHAYVSIGHLPQMMHDKTHDIYLAIFICEDKNKNRIMVGINIKELQDIWTQLNSSQIKYENVSGD